MDWILDKLLLANNEGSYMILKIKTILPNLLKILSEQAEFRQ